MHTLDGVEAAHRVGRSERNGANVSYKHETIHNEKHNVYPTKLVIATTAAFMLVVEQSRRSDTQCPRGGMTFMKTVPTVVCRIEGQSHN
jgi:hypothetical protein